ncbi:MAG: hypothetical protein C5B50_01005 [Verrucomicrobia bacterium]|nr:MAG: hypothetical protein C5B50_01005 [Verrucomicrobiota bacterium]
MRYKPTSSPTIAELPPAAPAPSVTLAPASAPSPSTLDPRPSTLKKVSLSGIAKKKDDTSNKYPVFPDPDGKAAEIAARIVQRNEQFEALKSALETDKAELGQTLVRPWYLRHFHRKTDVPSSVLVNFPIPEDPQTGTPTATGNVRVTVKDQYATFPNEEPFAGILGDQLSTYFRQSFELKIAGDKIPGDKAAELVEKIQLLFAEYDCTDALEAKECIRPVPNFKELRFAQMGLDQSLALETIGEKGLTQIAVSTKNVRK